jgi:ligand-binding sensor domain-containing protein
MDDGLPSNEVYHSLQDSKGYLWFATDNGVSRFDGYDFVNYSIDDGLAGNVIFYMCEDYKKRIWFVSYSKQLSYFENDSIYPYKYNKVIQETLEGRNIILTGSFYVDSAETVHFGTSTQGMFSIDSTGKIIKYESNTRVILKKIDNKLLYSYEFGKKTGQLLVDTANIKRTVISKHFNSFRHNIYGAQLGKNLLLSLGFKLILIDAKDSVHKIKSKEHILWVGNDGEGGLWVSKLGKGVSLYKDLELSNESEILLSNKSVLSVLKDNDNAHWITTTDGVYFFPSIKIKCVDGKESVKSVTTDGESKLWWSESGSGIYCLDRFNNQINKVLDSVIVYNLDYNKRLNRLFFSGENILGYSKKNEYRCLQTPFSLTSSSYSVRGANKVIQINDTLSWISVIDLRLYNTIRHTVFRPSYLEPIKGEKALSVYQDSCTYIGTTQGLWQMEDSVLKYLGLDYPLLKRRIDDIAKDDDGDLWLASKGNGLFLLTNDTLLQVKSSDGLVSNSVTSLYIHKDTLWVGTMSGLSMLDIKSIKVYEFSIKNVTKKNGIVSNVINDLVVFNRKLYLGTDKGLSYFNMSDYDFEAKEVPLYFTNVSILEQDMLVQDYYKLEYFQNSIKIDFVGLSYRNAGKVEYKYRLKGVDAQWTQTSSKSVRYPSLSPGKYNFELLASNENGKWNKEAIAIQFVIAKPYWQAWWFYSLLIFIPLLIVSSILFLFYEMRLKESKKRNHLRNNLNKLKQEALAQQMNPHFIFNTLSSIQYYINENDKDASNKYLTKFSRLMRMTLNNTYQKDISLQEEIDALEIYIELEQLRFEGSFRYSINQLDGINLSQYRVPALLLQPFVENAIWHGIMHKEGKSGDIQITFAKREDYLLCKITDNGIGREKSAEINRQKKKTHKSLGVKITESRLKLINLYFGGKLQINYKDLKDRNGNAKGTEVSIHLPIIS